MYYNSQHALVSERLKNFAELASRRKKKLSIHDFSGNNPLQITAQVQVVRIVSFQEDKVICIVRNYPFHWDCDYTNFLRKYPRREKLEKLCIYLCTCIHNYTNSKMGHLILLFLWSWCSPCCSSLHPVLCISLHGLSQSTAGQYLLHWGFSLGCRGFSYSFLRAHRAVSHNSSLTPRCPTVFCPPHTGFLQVLPS